MKIKTDFTKSTNLFLIRGRLTVFLFVLFVHTSLFSQLRTAQEISNQMKVGWNLGNTLEAIGGETAWGNPKTSQKLIDSVKAAGYDAVRLPCAWDGHTTNGVIHDAWIARVKEVIDYCINDSMYVILNIHWDGGWLENNVTTSAQSAVNAKQQNYWTQIANYFMDYDEHLLFASANEPNVENAAGMSVLLSYHQTFINAVRATGGNNSSRTLIIQGPSTDIDKTNNLMNTMPKDSIANRLMVEVHYYTPYQFCGLTSDATWGKMFYYWGNGYHSATDAARNATWGEESQLDNYLALMKTKFVDKGIPVILGEYGAVKRTLTGTSDQQLHLASRLYFYKYFVKSAVNKGIIPFNWDTGPYGNNTMGIFDRTTGAAVDRGLLNAIMQSAGKMNTTSAPKDINFTPPNEFRLDQNYPNPFNPATTITFTLPEKSFVTLKVYDALGREVSKLYSGETMPGTYTRQWNAEGMPSGIFFYRLQAGSYGETKKLVLIK